MDTAEKHENGKNGAVLDAPNGAVSTTDSKTDGKEKDKKKEEKLPQVSVRDVVSRKQKNDVYSTVQ